LLSKREGASILAENNKLKKLVIKQEKSISEKDAKISEKDTKISEKDAKISEQDYLIARLQRMLFPQKRERFESPINQLDIFQEIPAEKQAELEGQIIEKIEVTYQREKKAHSGRTKLPDNLEVVETVIQPRPERNELHWSRNNGGVEPPAREILSTPHYSQEVRTEVGRR
jgi:hypothetical protein